MEIQFPDHLLQTDKGGTGTMSLFRSFVTISNHIYDDLPGTLILAGEIKNRDKHTKRNNHRLTLYSIDISKHKKIHQAYQWDSDKVS